MKLIYHIPACLFLDYVGFIKKIMKLMQNHYTSLQRLEVELTQLAEGPAPPPRPCKYFIGLKLIIYQNYNFNINYIHKKINSFN